jgi:hypothetical protein
MPEKVIWAASYLKGNAFALFEPYIIYYLEKGNVASCDPMIAKVINKVGNYLNFLLQFYKDLNKARTSELRLLELVQTVSVPEYLTRFTQYAFRMN